jgi:hypothetical protein
MMKMLIAGGLKPPKSAIPPLWESPYPTRDHSVAFIRDEECDIFKVLHPHRYTDWPDIGYKWIFTRRNYKEQEKSMQKLAKSQNAEKRKFNVAQANVASLKKIQEIGGPVLEVAFEDVLKAPRVQAERVKEFLQKLLNINAMVAVVRKRSPKCAKTMEEFREI